MQKKRVLVWTDAAGVSTPERPISYPEGIHEVVAEFLNQSGEFEAVPFAVEEECLASDSLAEYQAIVMWGHGRPISMDAQRSVVKQVESGSLGIVGLHSILVFPSNPLLVARLFGQTAHFGWEDDVPMRYTPIRTDHPVFEGVDAFEIEDEAYYEPFGLAEGCEVLLEMGVPDCETRMSNVYDHALGRYEKREFRVSGLISRAGWTYQVGHGRSLFFQPGHETCPTYRNELIQQIITRAVHWVAAD